jgi:hypothetical protein
MKTLELYALAKWSPTLAYEVNKTVLVYKTYRTYRRIVQLKTIYIHNLIMYTENLK